MTRKWLIPFMLFVVILTAFILLSCYVTFNILPTAATFGTRNCDVSCSSQMTDASYRPDGWQPVGHTYKEQLQLRDMSVMIAAWPETAEDNVPTVPCLSSDGHLLVLSVAASRVRYGMTLTFVMVYPSDVKTVLPKNVTSSPLSSDQLSLWCVFDDGSVTPAYSYDSKYGNDRASLLDCALSSFASNQLWKYSQTIRVYLASTTDADRNVPILKAFVQASLAHHASPNASQELLTMCTSPLHSKADYVAQWIEFHRLVGFRKFVVYNSTDADGRLAAVLDMYATKYPGLIDVVQWNFSSLRLVDVMSTRYFQVEALHDCLIRYGDQSEWIGTLDLDEYIVPLHPYKTISDYLHEHFGRHVVRSINLWSQFFCTRDPNQYTTAENNISRLTIERFTFRARHRYKREREKYLYRPRFVQYLSIHHQIVGLPEKTPSEGHIVLAHYAVMNRLRKVPGCGVNEYVEDTTIRDRFASEVKNEIATSMTSTENS